jgi:hypothetical protein
MKTHKSILFLCGLILITVPVARAQEWRRIVPLKSTRADVEALLGPNDKSSYAVDYELADGVLFIEYSSGPCRKDRRGGWNVPEGVVISFNFSPKNKQREIELKLNRKKFRRVISIHTPSVTYYINDKEGMMYEIQQGQVHSIEYYPPKGFEYLYCGDAVEGKRGSARITPLK